MSKWAYIIISERRITSLESSINEAAEDGWEAISLSTDNQVRDPRFHCLLRRMYITQEE
ncbi:MAG: hypothetical protein ACXADY_04020 [Candidatus Hodarchaeales archaeon]